MTHNPFSPQASPARVRLGAALRARLAHLTRLARCLAWWAGLGLAGVAGVAAAQSAPPAPATPSPERQGALVRMVRQDCGSCHGMRLTGGLGPALTPQALEGKPLLSMASTIYGGRPGTPMPGWSAMLTQDEAQWVAQQLADGFPEEPRRPVR